MKEEFLHYIWKYQLFNNPANLFLEDESEVLIIDTGIFNQDSGPDFFNAKIKIDNTLWVGNVEIHINSSDWLKHNHQLDKAYNNVILHVVFNHDREIEDKEGNVIPTLELKNLISKDILKKYNSLMHVSGKNWIPCGNQIKTIDEFTINLWLNRVAIERLEHKAIDIENSLNQNNNNWEETFYQYLFKYFGLKVNAEPFFQVAINTPLKIVEKHNSITSVEALFYGQSGLLEDNVKDEYFIQLQQEYSFLKAKFSLQNIDKSMWKFLRLRPFNFPTIRISQLSSILLNNPRLFSKMIAAKNANELQKYFKTQASEYWNNHYQFGKLVKENSKKHLGQLTINNIIINVVVPFTFVYGKVKRNEEMVEKAINLLEELKPEQNAIIKSWQKLGVKSSNALHTQSLLEIKNNYCSEKKCLNCGIGNKILQL